MPIDVPALLKPISPAAPAGSNLRTDAEKSGLYFALKENRVRARARERQADVGIDRNMPVPEWRAVHDGSVNLLQHETKDIEIVCWLIEAALRLEGFSGYREGLLLLDGLLDRYWTSLHSVDDETVADKVGPIAGLNGIDAEGTLIQPLRLARLTAVAGDEAVGVWVWREARRLGPDSREAKLVAEALRATPHNAFAAMSTELEDCWEAFLACDRRLDALCGADAPPSGLIRAVLDDAKEALRDMSGIDPRAAASATAAVMPVVEAPTAAATSPAVPGELQTRDEALLELARVARFFREREPHSPISYALETMIRRARLPLAELLRELIPDEAVRRSALNMAGITPDGAPTA